MFDSYEKEIDKLVRRIDLLENNLNQYFNKWFVLDATSCYQRRIRRPVMLALLT